MNIYVMPSMLELGVAVELVRMDNGRKTNPISDNQNGIGDPEGSCNLAEVDD